MALTVTIDKITSFTDSGQEFRLDCILNVNGSGASSDLTSMFLRNEIKTSKPPKSGHAISLTSATVLVYDPATVTLTAAGAVTSEKAAGTFWFRKQ
jgi:hypothetical protein